MPSKKKPARGKPKKQPRRSTGQPKKAKPKPSPLTKSSRRAKQGPPPRPKPQKKRPRKVGGPSGALPPRKPGKAPKRPAKPTTKRPKKPVLTGKARKPVIVGGVKLPRKRWGKRDLGEAGYTNGRLRAKLIAEIKELRKQLAVAQSKKPAKGKKPPRKSRQQRGFDLLEKLIDQGAHPREQDDASGEEFYKLIAEMTKMSEHDAYATLMGSPPDVGVAA